MDGDGFGSSGGSPSSGKSAQVLPVLAISILSCFLVPAAFWLIGRACPRGAKALALEASLTSGERAERRRSFYLVLVLSLVGGAVVALLMARMAGLARAASPYAVLGLADGVDSSAVRKAYRRLSLSAHPDKPGGDALLFQRIVRAYETLTDPAQRAAWEAGADAEEGGGRGDGLGGLDAGSLRDTSGKALMLGYLGVLFVGIPLLGWAALGRGGGGGGGGGGARAAAGGGGGGGGGGGAGAGAGGPRPPSAAAQRAAEASALMLREDRREERAAAERAAAAGAAAKAAGRKAAAAAARAAAACAEAAIQARRREEEQARLAAEAAAGEDLAAAAGGAPGAFEAPGEAGATGGARAPCGLPWSPAEVSALAKALAKFPGGARNRWGAVAAAVSSAGPGRAPEECIARAKEAASRNAALESGRAAAEADKLQRLAVASARAAEEADRAQRVADAAGAGGGAGAAATGDKEPPGDLWAQAQQAALEEAMRRLPPGAEGRWAAIAACVPGKSEKQCVARFKALRAILLAKQAAEGEGAA